MSYDSLVSPVIRVRSEVTIDLIVRAAQRGDEHAFATLYDRHAPRIYAVCLRMSGDGGVASELLQDVFVRAWERLASFRGESAFATWLHRLAVNVVLESGRRNQRRRRRVTGVADLPEDPPDRPGRSVDPGTTIDLESAMALLPETARRVFVLHDVEGYPHAEIAELLGMVEATARSHLFRARRQLRELLA